MRKLLTVLLATAAIGIGAAAAQSNSSGPLSRPSATPGGAAAGQAGTILSERDVREKLIADGYSNVGSLKREGNIYSTDATKNGRKVGLSIDARSGKVDVH